MLLFITFGLATDRKVSLNCNDHNGSTLIDFCGRKISCPLPN